MLDKCKIKEFQRYFNELHFSILNSKLVKIGYTRTTILNLYTKLFYINTLIFVKKSSTHLKECFCYFRN